MDAGVVTSLLAAADPTMWRSARDRGLLPEVSGPGAWNGALVDEALAWADRLVNEPDRGLSLTSYLRFFHDGNRQEYEDLYFHRRRRLEVFALAVLSGRGDRFRPALEQVLWTICEEGTWALPAHLAHHDAVITVDLFAAETASALAEIRCLVDLAPELVERIEAEVERRVLTPYFARREPWAWEAAPHNWSAVCGGGVGLAALWLLDDHDKLSRLMHRLGPTLEAYLSGFSDDGLCLEGMGYWTYGFGYFVAFAELLRQRSRGATDLLGHASLAPRLRSIAEFPAVGRIGQGEFVRFSDALEEYRYPPGLVARLQQRLGVPTGLDPSHAENLAYDPCCRWARHLRDVLWTTPSTQPSLPAGVRWFPSAQWLLARGEVAGVPVGLAAKGGNNDEPHNHNDLGTFELVVGDKVFVDDLGAGRYERDYFREGRYGYFVNSSRSHAVPFIDGREQQAGASRRARAAFEDTPAPRLTLDLEAAYDAPGLASFRRTLTLTPTLVLPVTLVDRFLFEGGHHEVIGRFVTRWPVTVDERSAVLQGSDRALRISAQPAPRAVQVVPVVYAPHEGPDRTVFCVDFVFAIGTEAELRFVLDLIS